MSRGRPSEKPAIVLDKWIQETEDQIWHFDKSKSSNGCYLVEQKFQAGNKTKFKADKGKAYGKQPVVMVFKTSNRSNAKTKMKIWNNENIDYIMSAKKLPGVPDKAEILELSVGKSFIEKYQSKYNL
ncbi:MAG: hypothetical protein GY823_09585 [Flavobacteriaceae bacterium]|nr:hypothetical protein [Flavobacteriaceae bacterium]